jgi:type III secretion system low calcium response chaperone LcrH/SycD
MNESAQAIADNADRIIEGLAQGLTIGDIVGLDQENLEAGYGLAFNLYNAGNFKDAETLFSGLCLYEHNDERFWMGLAGSRQALGNYAGAIDAYGMACYASALNDPAPTVHAGLCYLQLGDRENARALFDAALELGKAEDATVEAYHKKAQAMLELIDAGEPA